MLPCFVSLANSPSDLLEGADRRSWPHLLPLKPRVGVGAAGSGERAEKGASPAALLFLCSPGPLGIKHETVAQPWASLTFSWSGKEEGPSSATQP